MRSRVTATWAEFKKLWWLTVSAIAAGAVSLWLFIFGKDED